MADFKKKKAELPKEGGTILRTGIVSSVSTGIKTTGKGPFPDLVTVEEISNRNTTWADPNPFIQLEQNNPKKCIGIANPYVLAPLLLNTPVNWNRVNAQETLMAAFAPTGSKSFTDIFTSKKSVLFSQRKINSLLNARMFPAFEATVYGAGTGAGAAAQTGKVAKSYGPILPSANYPPPSARAGSQPPASLPFKTTTVGNVNDVVDDSMQGACTDCYFIAALYSRAWCSYPAFPPAPAACPNGYNITFYTPACGSVTKCATTRFPIDVNQQPVFAQMTTEWELWTALYEKAYAMFIGLRQSPLSTTPDDPDISVFPQGDPLLSLFHLTKMKWDFTRNNTLNQPTAFLTKDLASSGFTSGYNAMNKNLSALVGGTSRKTMNPTVAWTYETKPTCSSAWFGTTSPYGNDLIVPSHSYSVLGSVTLNARNYIVLRNPWGANYVGDPSGTIGQHLATGTFTPAAGISFDLGRKPNGITTDGIFGLRTEVFDCLFQGFGWVQFRCA